MSVRLFVGNMPYGATEADLRAHFAAVGEPSQIAIPLDRATGRPRGFAFVEYQERELAEEAINRFNQQPFMGRSLSVSEARPREERSFAPRPAGAGGGGFSPRPPGAGGGFQGGGGGGGFRGPAGPPSPGGRNFGPPKRKGGGSDKRWESKDKGPKGPLKERFTGRMGGLYDELDETPTSLSDFDDPASSTLPDDDDTDNQD